MAFHYNSKSQSKLSAITASLKCIFLSLHPEYQNTIDLTGFQCISTETKLNAYTSNMETTTHSLYIYDTNVVMVCPEMRKTTILDCLFTVQLLKLLIISMMF